MHCCIVFSSLYLNSCFQEDVAINPQSREVVYSDSVLVGDNYDNQVYYNINSKKVISSNKGNIWDLAFECELNSHYIRLNFSKTASVANLGSIDFDTKISIEKQTWLYDRGGGLNDSTACGKWWNDEQNKLVSKKELFLLDRGFQQNPNRYMKFMLLDVNQNYYTIKFANLDGSNQQTMQIEKDFSYNNVFLSFDSMKVVKVEPPSDQWDLLFTRYLIFFESLNWDKYSAVGVLTNSKRVSVACDSSSKFTDISIKNIDTMHFSNRNDQIGYDWKQYNFLTAYYDIRPNKSFVIKDIEGFYYKLRFVDYYCINPSTNKIEKGYPKFEFKRL